MTGDGIGGLVLAAGMGRRLGTAKLRLTVGTESFLRRCVRMLRSAAVDDIVCVVSPEHATWAEREAPDGRMIVNTSGSEMMLSSVRLGVAALAGCRGVVMMPVDHPYVQELTIRMLMDAGRCQQGSVIKPLYKGHAGHPIIVPREVVPAILASGDRDTLRGILAATAIPVWRVEVEDPGVLQNINMRGDFPSSEPMEE